MDGLTWHLCHFWKGAFIHLAEHVAHSPTWKVQTFLDGYPYVNHHSLLLNFGQYAYIYPPTPALAKAGAACGTTGGVEPALSRPWPSHSSNQTLPQAFPRQLLQLPAGLSKATLAATRPRQCFKPFRRSFQGNSRSFPQAFPRQLSQLHAPDNSASLSKATLAATGPSHLFLRAFKTAVWPPSNLSNPSAGLSKATLAATRPSHLFLRDWRLPFARPQTPQTRLSKATLAASRRPFQGNSRSYTPQTMLQTQIGGVGGTRALAHSICMCVWVCACVFWLCIPLYISENPLLKPLFFIPYQASKTCNLPFQPLLGLNQIYSWFSRFVSPTIPPLNPQDMSRCTHKIGQPFTKSRASTWLSPKSPPAPPTCRKVVKAIYMCVYIHMYIYICVYMPMYVCISLLFILYVC